MVFKKGWTKENKVEDNKPLEVPKPVGSLRAVDQNVEVPQETKEPEVRIVTTDQLIIQLLQEVVARQEQNHLAMLKGFKLAGIDLDKD